MYNLYIIHCLYPLLDGNINLAKKVSSYRFTFRYPMHALIINLINVLCNNTTVNHMVLLAVTLGITYIGGGILPSAMLPEIVQRLSTHMPGAYLISTIGHSIFGL